MSVSIQYTTPTGKQNLMASFNKWLIDNIPGGHYGVAPLPADKSFFWAFNYPIAPQFLPAINITEIGLFNLGELAFEKLIGFDSDGREVLGQKNQTLIEIVCTDQDNETYTQATNKVYHLRDQVVNALQGKVIPLLDYNDPSLPKIGIIELDPESNSINEKFVVDINTQQLKRYVLLVRVFWYEILKLKVTATITSDAQIA